MARRKLAGRGSSLSREILVLLMNPPPRGCLAEPDPGGSHRQFPSTPEGWFPVKGKTRSQLNEISSTLSLAPVFYGLASLKGGLQKVLWDA
jgi:hypothetical protein